MKDISFAVLEIVFAILILYFGMLTIDAKYSHYDDKGYRFCMHLIGDNNPKDLAPSEVLSCESYLGMDTSSFR